MSSPARPSLVSTMLFGVAGAVWVFLLARIIMLIVDEKPFVGNPAFTFALGGAIVLTIAGVQLRCRDQIAALNRPILLTESLTAEIRPTTYRGTAPIGTPSPTAAPTPAAVVDVAARDLARRLNKHLRAVDDA